MKFINILCVSTNYSSFRILGRCYLPHVDHIPQLRRLQDPDSKDIIEPEVFGRTSFKFGVDVDKAIQRRVAMRVDVDLTAI